MLRYCGRRERQEGLVGGTQEQYWAMNHGFGESWHSAPHKQKKLKQMHNFIDIANNALNKMKTINMSNLEILKLFQ